jgi:predicted AlkP superfamily phosphohydrolase/phosphomutase
MTKVLIIGLDGGDPHLVRRFMEAGDLPHLAGLAERGHCGPLLSTANAMSPAAWSSFVTGLNPGNHGVFYFLDRIPGTYQTRYVSSQSRAGTPLWSALSAHGRRVCSLFVPLTYPAVEVNGVLASGWLAPSLDSPRYGHPADLAQRIRAIAPDFELHTGMTEFVRRGQYQEALDRKLRSLDAKARVATDLLADEDWDLFTVVFDETDPIQHYFWHFMDETHPEHTPEGRRAFGDAILRIYQAADVAVGTLLERVGDETQVLVISDHGYGPNQRAQLYLRGLLRACGLETPARRSLSSRTVRGAYAAASRALPSGVKHRLANRFRSLHERVEQLSFAGDIDWRRTRAYTFWSSGCSEPWINLEGRDPEGIVAGEDCAAVIEEVRAAVLGAVDDRTGRPVARQVLRKDEAYAGPHLDRAPDLLIEWQPDLVTTGLRTASGTAVAEPIAEDLRTGNHRREGLLIAGNGSRQSAVHGPQSTTDDRHGIEDVAATVYGLLGLPPPHPLDGRAWEELFPGQLTVLPPTHGSIGEAAELTEADRAVLEQRLSDLGYL